MPRLRLLAAFLITGLTLSAILPPVAPLPRTVVADLYFPTKVGTTLVYETSTGSLSETVTAVRKEQGAKVVTVAGRREYPSGRAEPYTYDAMVTPAGVRVVRFEPADRFTPFTLLHLAPRARPTWESREAMWVGGKVGHRDVVRTHTVGAAEMVNVPAGTFRAVAVETVRSDGPPHARHTDWFAPGVGRVKHVSVTWARYRDPDRDVSHITVAVLKSFTPGTE